MCSLLRIGRGRAEFELMSRGNRAVPFSTGFVCRIMRIVRSFFLYVCVVVDVGAVGLYFITRVTITAN